MTVAKGASMDDGKFEIVAFRKKSTYKLLTKLIKASTVGLDTHKSLTKYTFYTTSPLKVQLDGEVHTLDTNTKVEIRMRHQLLSYIT